MKCTLEFDLDRYFLDTDMVDTLKTKYFTFNWSPLDKTLTFNTRPEMLQELVEQFTKETDATAQLVDIFRGFLLRETFINLAEILTTLGETAAIAHGQNGGEKVWSPLTSKRRQSPRIRWTTRRSQSECRSSWVAGRPPTTAAHR